MNDSNTLDNWVAAAIIVCYVIWFIYQLSKKEHE